MEATITPLIEKFCEIKGLEAAPFKLQWYNEAVTNDKFRSITYFFMSCILTSAERSTKY